MKKPKCEACGDTGVLIVTYRAEHIAIERCDVCNKFKGDLEAAASFFKRSQLSLKYCLESITIKPI